MGVLKKFIVTLATVLSLLAFGLVSQAVGIDSSESTEESSELMVCVNWETKEVRYSKYWENCPSQHATVNLGLEGPQGEIGPEGPIGPRGPSGGSGSTTSLWDSLSSCYQKLQSGMAAGLNMAAKSDRDFFESASGCTVENAIDQTLIDVYKRAGVPVVESVEFKSITGATQGGNILWESQVAGNVVYDIRIANHLAISSLGSSYSYCTGGYGGAGIEQIEGNLYRVTASYIANPTQLTSTIDLGFRRNSYSECTWEIDTLGLLPDIVIQEDPSKLQGKSGVDDLFSAWGW